MTNIPLSETQIIWDPDEPNLPPAKLVRHKREDDQRYSKSWGACNFDFSRASGDEQVNLLFRQFVHMTVVDAVDPKALHDIFMDIPEYREALGEFGSIERERMAE